MARYVSVPLEKYNSGASDWGLVKSQKHILQDSFRLNIIVAFSSYLTVGMPER